MVLTLTQVQTISFKQYISGGKEMKRKMKVEVLCSETSDSALIVIIDSETGEVSSKRFNFTDIARKMFQSKFRKWKKEGIEYNLEVI